MQGFRSKPVLLSQERIGLVPHECPVAQTTSLGCFAAEGKLPNLQPAHLLTGKYVVYTYNKLDHFV